MKRRFKKNSQVEAMKKVRKTWDINPKSRLTDEYTGKNGQKIYRRKDFKKFEIDEEDVD